MPPKGLLSLGGSLTIQDVSGWQRFELQAWHFSTLARVSSPINCAAVGPSHLHTCTAWLPQLCKRGP